MERDETLQKTLQNLRSALNSAADAPSVRDAAAVQTVNDRLDKLRRQSAEEAD